jgi:hypothetical protein
MVEHTNPSGDRAERELHPIALYAYDAYRDGVDGRPGFSAERLARIGEMAKALLVVDVVELDWAARSVGRVMNAIVATFQDLISIAELFAACSPALPALQRANEMLLIERREGEEKRVMHAFCAFSDTKPITTAPRYGAAPPSESVVLRSIAPSGKIGR